MGTKTVTIKEEAYRALRREKRHDESFSDVIARLTSGRGRLAECYGAWEMDENEMQEFQAALDRYWHRATMQQQRRVKSNS